MIVDVSTRLAASADSVWSAVKQPSTLVEVTRGFLRFDNAARWPEIWTEGVRINTRYWFFGVVPALWTHKLLVARVDEANREIESNESGGFVRRWNHLIRVTAQADGDCRYQDRIDVGAGLLTPIVWSYASAFYRFRQMRWRKFARSLG